MKRTVRLSTIARRAARSERRSILDSRTRKKIRVAARTSGRCARRQVRATSPARSIWAAPTARCQVRATAGARDGGGAAGRLRRVVRKGERLNALCERVAPAEMSALVELMDSALSDIAQAPAGAPSSVLSAAPSPVAGVEGVREGNERLVLLTESAGRKVASLVAREKQGDFLRVAISGGGCNGLSYKMKFVALPKRGDILVRTGGVAVVVDSKSALYLKGTHVDYSHALVAGGFKFSNPNAKASCSCGESFSI